MIGSKIVKDTPLLPYAESFMKKENSTPYIIIETVLEELEERCRKMNGP